MYRRQRFTLAAAVVALAATLPLHAAIDSPIRRTFQVREGGTLRLEASVGDVRIVTGNASSVTVEVQRSAKTSSRSKADEIFKDLEIAMSQQGDDVIVKAKYDHPFTFFSWGNDLEVRYVVTVPPRYNADLSTSGGDIRIADLAGSINVKTSGGNIDVGRIGGAVTAHSSGGDIVLAAATGNVDVHTSGGGIRLGDIGGVASVKTSGGSIAVRRAAGNLVAATSGGGINIDEALGAIDARSSGGSITARFAQQPRGDSRLATSGGSVTVSFAPNVAVEVDAHTSGGDVESDLPVTVLGRQSESTLNGRINGGGPRVVLRSSGGDIRLRRL